ncbi:MAG: hypothetical protein OXP73_06040 [Chloroflexota bacterium]|nr:hypothetical protein [Chloroflexota bacterium]
MLAIPRALALAVALGVLTLASAAAHHATPCINANDAYELAAGREQNVGIYPRVYGDVRVAEAVCQHEHRDQRRFTWRHEHPPASTPAPPPPAAPDPTTHPDYGRVYEVAQARSGQPELAARMAADVIGRGAVDAFLRGTDSGVLYGAWACPWQSSACPLAPVYVPPPEPSPPPVARGPQIDPGLQPAWDILRSIQLWDFFRLQPGHDTVNVRFDIDGRFAVGIVSAAYHPRSHTILVNPARRHANPGVLAVTIAHELWHAVSPFGWPRNFDACVVDEVWAFITQGLAWHGIFGHTGPPADDFAWSTWRAYDVLVSHPRGAADFDSDVSDWPDMLSYVLFTRDYVERCAA